MAWLRKHRRDLFNEENAPMPTKLVAAAGRTPSFWSDVFSYRKPSFAAAAARSVEASLGIPYLYLEGVDATPKPPSVSDEALEIAAIYDALADKDRRVLRATAHALIPPEPPPERQGALLPPLPTIKQGRARKTHGA